MPRINYQHVIGKYNDHFFKEGEWAMFHEYPFEEMPVRIKTISTQAFALAVADGFHKWSRIIHLGSLRPIKDVAEQRRLTVELMYQKL